MQRKTRCANACAYMALGPCVWRHLPAPSPTARVAKREARCTQALCRKMRWRVGALLRCSPTDAAPNIWYNIWPSARTRPTARYMAHGPNACVQAESGPRPEALCGKMQRSRKIERGVPHTPPRLVTSPGALTEKQHPCHRKFKRAYPARWACAYPARDGYNSALGPDMRTRGLLYGAI